VEPDWVEKVIELEKPDGIIAGFGGQTALNCAVRLDSLGILEKHGVRNLGTAIDVLRLTEDRDLFAQSMKAQSIPVPPSEAADRLDIALAAAERIGYPVIVRAAYALGGLGSGFAKNPRELSHLVEGALATSPQVLIDTLTLTHLSPV
jgi:carbamoyl-phosphate synthase large subunit